MLGPSFAGRLWQLKGKPITFVGPCCDHEHYGTILAVGEDWVQSSWIDPATGAEVEAPIFRLEDVRAVIERPDLGTERVAKILERCLGDDGDTPVPAGA